MYSIQFGTALDVSYLIKMLPVGIDKNISKWAVVGFSLGGHATILALAHYPLIHVGVSIVGCADYETLMTNRARDLGYAVPPISYQHISGQLLECLKISDPINLVENFKGKKLLLLNGGQNL
jgi:pimeloyl-ACP methyl ester carboxylesterase